MKLEKHGNDDITLKLNLGEGLYVEFSPEGANEPLNGLGPRIQFLVSTVSLPGGKMGLVIRSPERNTFQAKDPLAVYLVDNPNNASGQTFELHENVKLTLKQVKCEESTTSPKLYQILKTLFDSFDETDLEVFQGLVGQSQPSTEGWIHIKDADPRTDKLYLIKTVDSDLPELGTYTGNMWRVQPLFSPYYMTETGVTHIKAICEY